MQTVDFNEAWRYARLGSHQYKDVCLPHDAMRLEKHTSEASSGVNGAWYEGYDYEYVKNFSLTEAQLQQKIYLEFEGVYSKAEVYINGHKAAFRPYGFTNFYVSVNQWVRVGENQVRVIARNAEQPNCRWYAGAGIYRPVKLHFLPQNSLCLNGVKIRTVDYQKREMEVCFSADGTPSQKVQFSVSDGENILFKSTVNTGMPMCFCLDNANLWSIENPFLYTLNVEYGEDVRTLKFGMRQVSVSAKNGFLLNGERVILQGACIHSDQGLLGAAAHPFADRRKIELIKNAGYNAIRSAHNPCSKATLDACDELGVLVLDEYTDGWYIHKTRYDYADYIMDWWQQDLKDMVDKDYNHPSVVMYSIGNEVAETSQKRGVEFCAQMCEYLHSLDERPVTCGINIFFNFLFSLGFGVYSEKKAEQGQKVGSAFFNNLAGIFGDKTMKLGATLPPCDAKCKQAFEKLDVAGYNYGINRYRGDLKKYPERIILGTETFCKDAYRFYELAKTHSALIGDFVWAGIDYLGEVGIGAWEYRTYAKDFRPVVGWISAGSGRIDLVGRQLGEALYTQVAFEQAIIKMAVVPVNDYHKPHSPSAWKMSNAIQSWSWKGCEGKKTYVEVYARAYAVQLLLNGVPVGKKKIKGDCKTKFSVRYQSGMLTAVALDKEGNILAKTSLSTAEGAPQLHTMPEMNSISGKDLAYVRLQYADQKGTLFPLARGEISVQVTGGELLALGNACPYNERGYLTHTTDVYYGEALAIIRPTAGEIQITAQSPYGDAQTKIQVLNE
ncbi:MAG: DUF4982 domain-containing protein [Clostridia bacterium]|nr:DUF4982 domain-containing protein [Clostridia bacterium]